MTMTPEAKSLLSKTIRSLRTRLLVDFQSSGESTYKFAIRKIKTAKLTDANAVRRSRIEAWIDEQVRAEAGKKNKRSADDFRRELEKQAAYTLLNRMLILRLMEAGGLHSGSIAGQGWNSDTYKTFRQLAPALVQNDETEGLGFLLQLVFEDLAVDLPGLFGHAGPAELIPVPAATLRAVVEALYDPQLDSCWTDDMTLGWVYQYWNDPEREALDAKINDGGKIEPHEIASKTQMFTERYMVDWLLQNSLGPMWLAMCKKHGWTPESESSGTLDALEQRRVQWRAKRDAGEVELTELMPLHTELERHWAYYVPQPIPDDAVEHAPESVRELKILDPAVGSGHFLIVAFDLLVALYREEAKHRLNSSGSSHDASESSSHNSGSPRPASGRGAGGEGLSDPELWTDQSIVERILEHNLHGIDLDPRAVQIAAAALWLKSQSTCRDARPSQLNLVASNLRLGSLPDNDPALVELRSVVERETGMPGKLTDTIVQALRGADHLGSLLQIDKAVDEAIAKHEQEIQLRPIEYQPDLFGTPIEVQREVDFDAMATRRSLLDGLESFLRAHTSGEDLGLRTRGEQLAAGVRFMRMIKEGTYDLVVANPPYQGTAKIESADYVEHHYSLGKADLYAAFLLRGLQLVREDGTSSMLTMRNWMFIKQYAELREHLLTEYDVRTLGDFDRGAFEDIRDEVVSVVVSVVVNRIQNGKGIALCPTCRDDRSRDSQRTQRKRAATLCHVGLTVFDTTELKVVPEWPVIYWWDSNFLDVYSKSTLLGSTTPASKGLCTGDETRLTRSWWEAEVGTTWMSQYESPDANDFISKIWFPYIKGGKGKKWIEPFTNTVNWYLAGLCIHLFDEVSSGVRLQNLRLYFRRGIAFTKIGSTFECRAHRYLSIFGDAGQSVFPINIPEALVLMNSKLAESTLKSLNPTPNFTPGDINRLPIVAVDHSSDVYATLTNAFAQNEYGREPSVEFKHPGPSPWRYAQEWAQLAVDRAEGEPLPEYVEQLDPEPPTDHISFAVGVALGRFGAAGEGILDPITADLTHALPAGVLFLDGTLADSDHRDSLGHSAAKIIHNKWAEFGAKVAPRVAVRDWLREKFFGDVHRKMYENRPIHWPLSSSKKTFVAWVNIHRMNGSTLRVLLADHLQPTLIRLEGELQDLRGVRDGLDKSASRDAEKRFAQVLGWRDELAEFIRLVEQCGEKGAPPTDAKCPAREVDARYEPDLDDGVMINSAALWPLLEPQWKDPKKWWKELCIASPKGNKDYDWSHLAMRYWPTRVDKKCQADPSLGVAHGCFWKYHPERAWAWELRLQDEIEQGFRIQEASYRGDGGDNEHRDTFLANHPDKAFDAIDKELTRRIRKSDDPIHEMRILEPGIWSALPHRCFALELRRSSTDSHDFRLHAPDSDSSRDQFLRTRTGSAASLVRAELLNRCSSREPLAEYRLPDSGLWLGAAEMCWALEREITRNQGEHAFQLVDPDSDVCRAEFVSKHSDAAMKIVALDIRSRSLTKQKPLASYTVTESGLWANCAAECYAIELEVIAKQKAPFRLIDPDHESLRAKYEKSSPEKAAERKALLDKFCPPVLPGMDSDPEPEPKKRKPRRTAK